MGRDNRRPGLVGALLARAHSRSIDSRVLDGYCEHGEELDQAIAVFAQGYADQTERDHERLSAAVQAGRIPVDHG